MEIFVKSVKTTGCNNNGEYGQMLIEFIDGRIIERDLTRTGTYRFESGQLYCDCTADIDSVTHALNYIDATPDSVGAYNPVIHETGDILVWQHPFGRCDIVSTLGLSHNISSLRYGCILESFYPDEKCVNARDEVASRAIAVADKIIADHMRVIHGSNDHWARTSKDFYKYD